MTRSQELYSDALTHGSSPITSHGSSSSARLTPDFSEREEQDIQHEYAREDHDAIELQRLKPRQGEEEGDDDDEGDGHLYQDHLSSRRTSVQSFQLYTPDEERRVRRKLDICLTLFVAFLYMLSFLDRSNIGNAKVAGLMRDLDIDDNQFEWLLTSFYIAYISFEWMTVLYQIFPPHIYISLCVAAWGILASFQALATTWSSLLFLRILLGIGEAAFVGIPFYLTFFYKREELALRVGLFIAAAPLATTFASSLAYAIMGFAKRTQIASWRLLFLLEGFPAILVAVRCWSWLPDRPEKAWWLTERERKVAVSRLRRGGKHRHSAHTAHKFSFAAVAATLQDRKAYFTAFTFFCCNVAFSSMPVFLPTIVNSMGFSERSSQGLSAPPFLVAFIAVVVTAIVSDRMKSRSIPLLFHLAVACCGYSFMALAGFLGLELTILRYLTIYLICAGFFSAITLIITWTVNNQESDEGKGTGMAILNIIGQCGPLVGTRLYPDSDKPYFLLGMTVCAAMMAVAAVLVLLLRFDLKRQNRLRARAVPESGSKFMFML